ncbi:MAG: formylmethanofuran dehydrogenase subunit B [Candidatus Nezhaarchaeota archaeon]|nr:formylmethanofuran dehydrogenase subunit B [Candidatus Nezhaarchaeota archaeon]MCX8141557.1 formylmethanofuran dehydrogenase subunit B [Candidatus Nezhaarchaeota archaeon]MDW8049824.1 formylmethanofuran dehydrogenase subunit B [Nitrososphaerota archaeon]
MPQLEVTLVTGRTLKQGSQIETDRFSKDYVDAAAICFMNPDDMAVLGVKEGLNVRVTTEVGSTVVKATAYKGNPRGLVFIPLGPWANALIPAKTRGTGMPFFKSIKATVEPTKDPIPMVEEIVLSNSGKKPLKVPVEYMMSPADFKGEGVIENHVCTICACDCDDLVLEIKGGIITNVKNACARSLAKFKSYAVDRVKTPLIRVGDELRPVSYDEAISRAAKILVDAKYPLLFGWSETSNEATRLGVRLAELVGGVIDNLSTFCHGPSIMGVQQFGIVTSTLGNIRDNADLMVFWGCNPPASHPRHFVRYSALARGFKVKSRAERKIIVVDVRETEASRIADMFVRVEPNMDYELLTALLMIVKGLEIEDEEVAGVPRETIVKMADMMMSAKFGVIFYGLGLTTTSVRNRNIEAAIKLVQALNDWTLFSLNIMRGHWNVAGSNQVLAWLTGYPYAVDLSRGYPRYSPGVTSTIDLLFRGEVDAAMIVASDPAAHFPAQALRHLAKIPLIVVDPKWSLTASIADVYIPTRMVGVDAEGSCYRMDNVALRIRKALETDGLMDDVELLEKLIDKVKEVKAHAA